MRPQKVLAQAGGKVDWLVEAETDPPARALTVKTRASMHGDCILIEPYREVNKVTQQAPPWFRQKQAPKPEPMPKGGAL